MNYKGLFNPRKFNYIKTFRNKSKKCYTKYSFKFGNFAIISLKNLLISIPTFIRFLRVIKANLKRKSKNYKKFFINYNFNYIYTKKPKGSRMGKGKGKKVFFWSKIKPGSIFIETKGYRVGKCKYISKKLYKITNGNFSYKKLRYNYVIN